ncbi:MAG TPA: biotin--[acetyl-CoA-carboxylase] ligase, partial [Alphaproteobacteria bacterium]|nr:biotin--[acetyl-CoA-carboxylase] ligase [Alphaproteobacteria bacterium]
MQIAKEQISEFSIIHYDILDSTNSEAKRLIDDKIAAGSVIITDIQLNGRGRNGKEWVSDEGNLFCSIIISPKKSPELYSFVAVAALAESLKNLGLKPQIKWPNDIKINDKKISGVLLEKYKDMLV